MRTRSTAIAIGAAALLLAGCTTIAAVPQSRGVTKPEGGPVPPGHMPPPGECRIWYPNTPPGQQPPPGNCAALSAQVPPGAILVGPGGRR
jgi:hypothetical protein